MILSFIMIIASSVMMSSCIILYDGEYEDYTRRYGTVVVENRDSNRTAYIKEIKYCEESSYVWKNCWTCPDDNNDSNISFYLEPGNYKFKIEVIYPKYKYNKDYYDIFYSGNNADITVYGGWQNTLVFDGEQLYER